MRFLVPIFSVALIWPVVVYAEITAEERAAVQAQLTELSDRIDAARLDANSFKEGSAPAILANVRAETLALTAAMLEARLVADDSGIKLDYTLPVVQPDPEMAARIEAEMAAQKAIIVDAEAEADKKQGLIQAVALSRVQVEKLTLARLYSTLVQARYGAMIPAALAESDAPQLSARPEILEQNEVAVQDTPQPPAWADANHNEIDYDHAVFEQLDAEGYTIHGWWGVLETRAEIDDSPKVIATQVEKFLTSAGSSYPALRVACKEGVPSFVYDTDNYLLTDSNRSGIDVTYRINAEDAVTRRWSETTSGEAAGLFNQKAVPFLRTIRKAGKIFLRIVERDGERHDNTFDLAGIGPVVDIVSRACGISTLDLSHNDYRAIQEMLNAAGFNAGTPDGIWGAASKRALRSYQESKNLPATGAPDAETLRKMGLSL